MIVILFYLFIYLFLLPPQLVQASKETSWLSRR